MEKFVADCMKEEEERKKRNVGVDCDENENENTKEKDKVPSYSVKRMSQQQFLSLDFESNLLEEADNMVKTQLESSISGVEEIELKTELTLFMEWDIDTELANQAGKRREIDRNPMIWYWEHRVQFAKLYQIAEYSYSSDVHECESERKFKVGKRIFTPTRSLLDPETGCSQEFLNDYMSKGDPFKTTTL